MYVIKYMCSYVQKAFLNIFIYVSGLTLHQRTLSHLCHSLWLRLTQRLIYIPIHIFLIYFQQAFFSKATFTLCMNACVCLTGFWLNIYDTVKHVSDTFTITKFTVLLFRPFFHHYFFIYLLPFVVIITVVKLLTTCCHG